MASVLYLTDTRFGQRAWDHPSARHRCYHYADELLGSGGNSAVIPMERLTLQALAGFDHVVFHRPAQNKRFAHALKCCEQTSVTIHADYDDLIFHPEYAKYSPLYVSGNMTLEKVEHKFNAHRGAAECFSSFISSTRFLQSKLLDQFPEANIAVLPNSLPRLFQAPAISANKNSIFTIGYFPGSNGHGEDFRSIREALLDVLQRNVRLLIVGRMSSDDYQGLPNVIHLPFASYNEYLNILSRVDLSIAPLVENLFSQSKSAVKLIESVAVGTPIVASHNQDMQDHINPLTTLIKSDGDWAQALSSAESSFYEMPEKYNLAEQAQILSNTYSVASRVPLLREHLKCAA